MITQIITMSLLGISRCIAPPDSSNGQEKWDTEPEFQRALVWSKKQKEKLVSSLKRGMPFGMITLVKYQGTTYVIDGKQRTTTLVSFMNNEFQDENLTKFEDWSEEEQAIKYHQTIPVQTITIEEDKGETWTDVIELFRRINTSSKALTVGQLLWSCKYEQTLTFMLDVFYNQTTNQQILKLRTEWASCFCKGAFDIKSDAKSRGDITFFSALTIPLLTGKNEAISTSYELLYSNGLKDDVTDEMKQIFFAKMEMFLKLAATGTRCGYFKKRPKGFPSSFGEMSILCFIVNTLFETQEPSPHTAICKTLLDGDITTFYSYIAKEECKEDAEEWNNRLRKNRTVKNLTADLHYIERIVTKAKNGTASTASATATNTAVTSPQSSPNSKYPTEELYAIEIEKDGQNVEFFYHEESGEVFHPDNLLEPVGRVDPEDEDVRFF